MDVQSSPASQWGRGLLSGGYVLLSIGGGVALGYWASDWELRFFPVVAAFIFAIWSIGFAMFAFGARLEVERLGRRARLFAGLSLGSVLALIATLVMARETPLTAMAENELRYTHELDSRYFQDLDRSLRGIVARLETRSQLFAEDRALTEEEEAFLLDAWRGYLDTAIALDRIRRFHEDYFRFDLSRMERVPHVRSFLLSFASELSLYENSTRIIELLEGNDNVVRFLNVGRREAGIAADSVARMSEELSGLTDLGRVAAGRRYLSFLDKVHHARADAVAYGFDWLWGEVDRYLGAVEMRRRRDAVKISATSDLAPVLREVKHLTFPIQKEIAEWMGDVRVRRPGKYLITPDQAHVMERELRAGDVLLGRKNWYLSNIGLPGFWPHAMLYVGSNESLAESFDGDEDVRAWVRDVSGRDLAFTEYLRETYPVAWRRRALDGGDSDSLTVIEAVSEGVIQNTLYGAAGDFIVALRPNVSRVMKAKAVARAFSYLDRPYDFDFDFATDQSLVCTEVVWRAYRSAAGETGLGLEPIPLAGRLTLPANEIARTFAAEHGSDEPRFQFVYYIEGREDEGRAVAADVAAFLQTPERGKWAN